LQYLVFAIGAGYFLWVIMFRMNKQKKEWIADHTPKASRSASGGATTSSARQSQRKKSGSSKTSSAKTAAPAARTRKEKPDAPVLTATGRALPVSNGRYTRPRGTSRASQRRS
jgi:cytoskeletal protein RodZ